MAASCPFRPTLHPREPPARRRQSAKLTSGQADAGAHVGRACGRVGSDALVVRDARIHEVTPSRVTHVRTASRRVSSPANAATFIGDSR
jgi:hypothetical protein